ncbi:MAG: ankyrin repeat domain-containing protein [Lysobacterales bacterium]
MKNIRFLFALIWVFSAPLLAQSPPANVTLDAVLIEFAMKGDLKTVQQLISAGVPVDASGEDKSTALMWSAFNGHTAVAAYLLENGAAVDARDINGRTALLYASSGPFAETVSLLLSKGAEVNIQGKTEGFTALMMAAAEGQVEVVKLLLAHGASAAIIDRDGDTAEKFAREKGHTAVLGLLADSPAESIRP